MLKVLIEASETYRNATGIGRFGRALIQHLPSDVSVVFSPNDYTTRQHTREARALFHRIRHVHQHFKLTQWDVARAAHREKPALIHSLSFFLPLLSRGILQVSTIFDLAYFDMPEHTDRFWGAYARRMMPIFAKQATAIITTSEVSREAIMERFGIAESKVHRIYGGVDARFRPIDDAKTLEALRQRYQLREPFVLYVGTWGRTKNLPVLLQACANLRDVQLVMTGGPHSAEEKTIPELAKSLNVNARFLGHVPDTEIPALYTLARVAVLPSLYEGFGLPVLEAMACGIPMVVSDIPVLQEISDGNAPTFQVAEAEALRAILLRLLSDDAEHAIWRKRALAHATRFSWDDTARAVVDVWRSVTL